MDYKTSYVGFGVICLVIGGLLIASGISEGVEDGTWAVGGILLLALGFFYLLRPIPETKSKDKSNQEILEGCIESEDIEPKIEEDKEENEYEYIEVKSYIRRKNK